MSIYKFMGGIVSDSSGGDESHFDPHEHRVIRHPTSYSETMTHMLKGSIGAGILAMPFATKKTGIFYGAILLILVGIFATYCLHLLISSQYKLCKRHKRGYMSYQKSMLFAVRDGPKCLRWSSRTLYWFVEVTLVIWQLGICTIYFVFVAENIAHVARYYEHPINIRLLIVFLLPPMLLLNLIKNLKMLAPLSAVSNVFTIIGLLLVCFYLIEDDFKVTKDKMQLQSFEDIPCFIGTALFALEAVGVILALEYNMKNPKQFLGLCGLFNIGMVIIVTLYLLMGTFGYLKYGDDIKPSITLNLPLEQKKARVAKILFAAAIFLSFPLQNFVAYSILWRRISKKYEAPAEGQRGPVSKYCMDYLIRIALVLIPFAVAVAVPALGPFIALFGAFCLGLLAFIFPAILSICIHYPDNYGPSKFRLIREIVIVILGFVIMVSGVYTSILDIVGIGH